MNRQNLVRRLLYLRNWEFVNIFFLPACLYISLLSKKVLYWQPYAYGMFVLCMILVQGVLYWHLKLQTIRANKVTLPDYFFQIFPLFKWLNVTLLLIYPLLILFGRITSLVNFQASIWANLLFLFAVLEYINYYHYQLSHDNLNDIRYLIKHGRIRESPLSTDLRQKQKTAT